MLAKRDRERVYTFNKIHSNVPIFPFQSSLKYVSEFDNSSLPYVNVKDQTIPTCFTCGIVIEVIARFTFA